MKDIDFDELDKAVNSLMATTAPNPANDTPKPEVIIDVPSSPAQSAPVSQPVAPVSETAATPVVVSRPAAAPSAAPAVRRGRFMDMVQTPQSTQVKPAATAPPSREGLSITPRSEASAEAPASAVDPIPAPSSTVGAPEPQRQEQTKPVSFDTMPDPLDMPSSTPAEAVVPVNSEPEAAEPVPTAPLLSQEPIESPFLSDAKVEKRPLNPNLGQELEQAAKEEPDVVADAPVESSQDSQDEPPVNPQIPELSSDLVAIESGDTVAGTQAIETSEAASQVDAPATPLGATSIAQQYKPKESSGDQSHAAIYDASQYPEPLSHPAKSKSGWLWVLWVIVLLGIGAGGAVLLYVLGIIP